MVNSVSIGNKYNDFPVKTGYTAPNFRSSTATLEKSPAADTVVITKPKQKKNPLAVAGGILACTAVAEGTFVGALVFKQKSVAKRIAKLYETKLIQQTLPEHIEFKEAKTLEEAIKFAKETLKIKEVDKNFTLEALNDVNRGIVDVSNYQKGKVYMPPALRYKKMEEDTLASVARNINSNSFAELSVNKLSYSNDVLDKRIEKLLSLNGSNKFYFGIDHSGNLIQSFYLDYLKFKPDSESEKLIKKYLQNKNSTTIKEKQTLCYTLKDMRNRLDLIDRNPLHFIKQNKEEIERIAGETINLETLASKTKEEQTQNALNLLDKCYKNDNPIILPINSMSPATTIYHEMGHLQDYGKNLKELDIKETNIKYDWKNKIKNAWEKAKCKFHNRKYVEPDSFAPVDNHFNRFDEDKMKKIYNNKERFKVLYPDLYEFATDEKIQQTAGIVSGYAQTGIGEFIADTYKELVKGTKLPQEVIELYKKYGGPIAA